MPRTNQTKSKYKSLKYTIFKYGKGVIKMNIFEKMIDNVLADISGGNDGMGSVDPRREVVANVAAGYLALRNYPATDESNEIFHIANGTPFKINIERCSGEFVFAYIDGKEGWVNGNFVAYLR